MTEFTYPLYSTGLIDDGLNLFYALFIGIVFGFLLERVGFGRSINIVPLFYLKKTKVMQFIISTILTSSTLTIIAIFNGWLDYNQLVIPITYLWPYVVGGILFGLGMVMSGWCISGAVIGFATGRIDAVVFLLGIMFGMYFYFDYYEYIVEFANSGNIGVYTIHNLLNGNIYTSSYISTVIMAICFIILFKIVKKLIDKKGESV